jgi:hypothetical protein
LQLSTRYLSWSWTESSAIAKGRIKVGYDPAALESRNAAAAKAAI